MAEENVKLSSAKYRIVRERRYKNGSWWSVEKKCRLFGIFPMWVTMSFPICDDSLYSSTGKRTLFDDRHSAMVSLRKYLETEEAPPDKTMEYLDFKVDRGNVEFIKIEEDK